ncbi:unnamed protein product [Ilex paraguariensis]|uniref:SANT domain-containing protein n=1 Tax=Ilex paraguariensis TaxID=185542 RepID=A0ABC8S515_9AQUA
MHLILNHLLIITGLEDNRFVKGINVYNDSTVLSGSPGLVPQDHSEGLPFNLENLDLSSVTNLKTNMGSSIRELLQSDDSSLVDCGCVRSTAMNQLLVLKGDILKAIEMTESEIDLLENELKSFSSEPGNNCPCPALQMEYHAKPCEELGAASNLIPRPASLQIDSSEDMHMERPLNAPEKELVEVKDDDIDSPGTVTSKFFEPLSLQKAVSLSNRVRDGGECSGMDTTRSCNLEVKCSVYDQSEDKTGFDSACRDGSQLTPNNSLATLSTDGSSFCDREDFLYDLIFASNKHFADRASEVFNKLLPTNQCHIDISGVDSLYCSQNGFLIKEKFVMRKRFLRFKERVLALKWRAFQHLWKEDVRLLSIRKYRAKSQKKFDLSLRPVHTGYTKHRSSIRSRFSYPAGNLKLVPTTEIINFTSKLLSDSQVKIYRNTFKMPTLILDKKEKMISSFISSNGLVEDPCAVEKERSMIIPWMPEEREIFIDKLATFGKDFRKIASFLDHKTTADCIEFYYKNHKSDCFEKAKKKPEFAKQGKSYCANTYLVTSGKRWSREINAASLDMLGAASAIAANVDDGTYIQKKCASRYFFAPSRDCKAPRGNDGLLGRSSSPDVFDNEREAVAADVLAGICGSLSSDAMSSCITSSVDPGECYQEWKCLKMGSSMKQPLTPEATQNVDGETCSDESCGEMDSADWTDEEKSMFIQAVASYGKDFVKISRCVRTRSRDQCKVFFSKGRKCLELDMIHHEPGNQGTPVNDEGNGGGSDAEDACVVETGPVICCEKSGSKMDEAPFSDLKTNHCASDPAEIMNLPPDINRAEENNGPIEMDSKDTGIRSENLVPDDCLVDDKLELGLDGDGDIKNGVYCDPVAMQDQESVVMPSNSEAGRDIVIGQSTSEKPVFLGVPNDNGLPTRSGTEFEAKPVGGVSAEHSCEPLLGEGSFNDKQVANDGANTCCVSDSNCSIRDSVPVSARDCSNLAADSLSSLGFGAKSEYQHKIDLEFDSAPKPCITLLQQDKFVALNSVPQDSTAIQYEKTLNNDTLSTLDLRKTADQQGQKSECVDDYHQHLSGRSLLHHVEPSSQILCGYPLSVSAKKERDGDISCMKPASLKSISKLDTNFHSYQYLEQDCYLKKCSSSKHNGSMAELPFQSQEQSRDIPRPPFRSSSDVEKPSRNGDVKLFGQILTHPLSQQKPNSSTNDNEDKCARLRESSGKSFNLKFTGNHCTDGNSALAKVNRIDYVGVENLPMRSYGFWDGNRIRTGFASLPDSAILLAKYPTAFGNYATSLSKSEQQPLRNVVKSSESTSKGVSVLPPTTEISSTTNGMVDYQVYKSRDGSRVQPFRVDMKQQEDLLFCEMQRRNGFEAIASVQQQARGLMGINVGGRGGGVIVGGSCTGVSDPVAAIKMHYAKAEQYSAQAGTITREDSWSCKRDIGR